MEEFAGHALHRRLDSGGSVELYEARALAPPHETRLVVRFANGGDEYPPWAWPAVARHIVHPNVVQLIDFLVCDGRAAAIVEYVPGVSLRELMRRQRLSPAVACHLVREVCLGLEAAFEAEAPGGPLRATLRHLCPRAVQLSVDGAVKVGPFCLGPLKPEGTYPLTEARAPVAAERLCYLAPEQAGGRADDGPEVDIFSAGAVLYQLLSGEPAAASPPGILSARGRPRAGSFYRGIPTASDALADVLRRMLAADPGERFSGAVAVARALEAVPELVGARDPRAELAAQVVSAF
jgi:serine/threonine-protein kinase